MTVPHQAVATPAVPVIVYLTSPQAEALAELAKRFRFDHAEDLSTKFDDGRERDQMLAAVTQLSRALADSGFVPR